MEIPAERHTEAEQFARFAPCAPKRQHPLADGVRTTSDDDAELILNGTRRPILGDITYIPTWEGWVYLAMAIDCCTKACIGYAMADHLRAELAIDALAMAARNYPLIEGAIFHSDRGTQYTSAAFAAAADLLGIWQSVGATGYVSTTLSPNPSTLP